MRAQLHAPLGAPWFRPQAGRSRHPPTLGALLPGCPWASGARCTEVTPQEPAPRVGSPQTLTTSTVRGSKSSAWMCVMGGVCHVSVVLLCFCISVFTCAFVCGIVFVYIYLSLYFCIFVYSLCTFLCVCWCVVCLSSPCLWMCVCVIVFVCASVCLQGVLSVFLR